MEFRRAFSTEPDQNSRRVYPIKGGDFAGHPHGGFGLQFLNRLNEKHAVISFTIAALIAMDALSLKKELLHGGYPSLAPHRASDAEKILSDLRSSLRIGSA
jgi:hypothetical protein